MARLHGLSTYQVQNFTLYFPCEFSITVAGVSGGAAAKDVASSNTIDVARLGTINYIVARRTAFLENRACCDRGKDSGEKEDVELHLCN